MKDFNKIVIVSLCDRYSRKIGETLSQSLGMLFCDTKELIEYELIDKEAVEKLCTKEYLAKSERKVLKHIASFEGVVVAISFDYLIHNINIIKDKSLIVFLKLSKNFIKVNGSVVDLLAYEERTKDLEQIATLVMELKKTDETFVCEKLIKALGGIV